MSSTVQFHHTGTSEEARADRQRLNAVAAELGYPYHGGGGRMVWDIANELREVGPLLEGPATLTIPEAERRVRLLRGQVFNAERTLWRLQEAKLRKG